MADTNNVTEQETQKENRVVEPSRPENGLWYDSQNDTASKTMVLLHGLGASHFEWNMVRQYLGQYHLLVPDMNGHSKSAHLSTLTVPAMAAAVAELIEQHAHNGKAYVVGLSMGGFVTLELARTRPELVYCAVVTGCAPFKGLRSFVGAHAGLVGAGISAVKVLPQSLRTTLMVRVAKSQDLELPKELQKDMDGNYIPRLHQDIFASLSQVKMESLKEVKVRALAAAGGKLDDVEATREQGAALRHGCSASTAVVIKNAYHPWTMQFSELFAQLVNAWIDEKPLPVEAVELKSSS